jgi:hypothetical protein
MAPTPTAMLQSQPGTSWDNAWPQVTGQGIGGQNLDLLQIVIQGEDGGFNPASVILNVDHAGVVHNPAVAATNGTRVGVFKTNLASGKTTAQYFADAFANPSLLDILQVISPTGGSVVKFLDYLGVSH